MNRKLLNEVTTHLPIDLTKRLDYYDFLMHLSNMFKRLCMPSTVRVCSEDNTFSYFLFVWNKEHVPDKK